MADRKINMEILWVKGSTNINTKLTIYYKCILIEFEDICASGCRSREFQLNEQENFMKGQLEKGRLPHTPNTLPNTRCHFVRKTTMASSFGKKKPKLSDNYIWIKWIKWTINGRPKIAFLWRHKFPPGCDGRISKFPIQSLLLSMAWATMITQQYFLV